MKRATGNVGKFRNKLGDGRIENGDYLLYI